MHIPKKYLLVFILALTFLTLQVSGQEHTTPPQTSASKKSERQARKKEKEAEYPFPLRRFEYGLNFGVYFPNKYSANFYNGTPGNVNKVDYVLNNEYWNDEIKQLLGISETDYFYVPPGGYPQNMHYNVAFSGGLFLRVNFDRKNGIFLQANYARLQASDVVTLKVPNAYLSYADLRFETVAGREGRVLIDLGYQRSFPLKSRINPYFQAGFTMCYTQMLKSVFIVEGKEYSMVNIYDQGSYVPNTSQQTIYVNQNAFGFGGYLGVGAGIPLTDMFGLEPAFFMQYYPTNLEGYKEFRPSFGVYLRIMLHFGDGDEDE